MAATQPCQAKGMFKQMSQAGDHKPDDITLIGEYALHLLDAEQRRAVDQRLLDDANLRQLLKEWDEGFVSLSSEIADETPPLNLKSKIDARLFPDTVKPSLWTRLTARLPVAIMLAAMLIVTVFIGSQYVNQNNGPVYVAEITGQDGGLVVQAHLTYKTASLQIDRQIGSALKGRSLELWLIAKNETTPVSLGVLPVNSTAEIQIPNAVLEAMIEGTLAISDEPLGGSPTGAPTGDVLAVGQVIQS